MSNSICKIHAKNILDPNILSKKNFGTQKYYSIQIFPGLELIWTKEILSYQHAWWTKKNSGLTILAAQIFLGLKILIAAKIIESNTNQVKYKDLQEVFWI